MVFVGYMQNSALYLKIQVAPLGEQTDQSVNSLQRCENYTKGVNGLCGLYAEFCIISKDAGRTARRTESFDQRDQSVNSLQRCENYTKGVNGLCGLYAKFLVLKLVKSNYR
jgi:hypothetical protein